MALTSHYSSHLPAPMYIYDTPSTNIKLCTLDQQKSLMESSYYGINGGWFNLGEPGEIGRGLLNVTYCDGAPVGSASYGTPPRDGTAQTVGDAVIFCYGYNARLSEEEVDIDDGTSALDITGITHVSSWAQGGIALSLGKQNWSNRKNVSPNQVANGWSAMVADCTTSTVHLIAVRDPSNKKTITQQNIRDAITEYFGITEGSTVNSRYKGILLDGGDSTQMRFRNRYGNDTKLFGAYRALCGIITLRNLDR